MPWVQRGPCVCPARPAPRELPAPPAAGLGFSPSVSLGAEKINALLTVSVLVFWLLFYLLLEP